MRLLLSVLVYALALWLGLYLLSRDWSKARLRYTGFGLVAYAALIGLETISDHAGIPLTLLLARIELPLLFMPGLCWFAAAVDLLPDDNNLRLTLTRSIRLLLPALILLLYAISLTAYVPIRYGDSRFNLLVLFQLTLLLFALFGVWKAYRASPARQTLAALLVTGIFFALSNGLLLVPAEWISPDLTLFLIGLDLVLLGLGIAVLDAFDEGETFVRDGLRSFTVSLLTALIFGGQAALVMLWEGVRLPLLALLLALISAAITIPVFADSIQTAIDRLVFARFPRLRHERSELRAAASAVSRVNETIDLASLENEEFVRLTRRALSHMGNLHRLAASPLTRLPLIELRLRQRGLPDNTLERAAELKKLLSESIERLKPRSPADFGTSDEWRFYNALYYPYVVGLKPYSRSAADNGLSPDAQSALNWIRGSVPERTLHNWQNAAARLVAQDLREQTGSSWQ